MYFFQTDNLNLICEIYSTTFTTNENVSVIACVFGVLNNHTINEVIPNVVHTGVNDILYVIYIYNSNLCRNEKALIGLVEYLCIRLAMELSFVYSSTYTPWVCMEGYTLFSDSYRCYH